MRHWPLFVLAVTIACGPSTDDGEGDTGEDTGTQTDGSGETHTGGSSGGSSGGGNTGSDPGDTSADATGPGGPCPPDRVWAEPGCGEEPGLLLPEPGCYFPCDGPDSVCETGSCQPAWINPCVCPEGQDCCDACGGEMWLCMEGLTFGEVCEEDTDCLSGICWDISDHDPMCVGTACSETCLSQADCQELAEMAGAQNPGAASCGQDGVCHLWGTGLGDLVCS
jgi:hypothetical protein